MRLHADTTSGALYLGLDDSAIVESEEVQPGGVLDFDADNQVVGVEILNVAKRVPAANLRRIRFKVP